MAAMAISLNRKQKQTIITIVASVLGLLVVIFAGLLLYKQNAYKKYTNKNYRFSMVYPSGWKMEEGRANTVVFFSSPKENELDFFQENVSIVTQDMSRSPKDLKTYTTLAIKQLKGYFKDNIQDFDEKIISFGGNEAYKVSYIGKGPQAELKIMHIWTILGTKAYQFTYTSISSQYDKYLPKVNAMADSFKIEK